MSGEPSAGVLLAVLGLAVAAYGSIIGAGGGFLLVPILLLLEPGESVHTLTSLSLAAVALNSLSGSVAYFRQGRVDVRSAAELAVAAIPGVLLGAWLTRFVPRTAFDAGFGLLLLALTVYLVLPFPAVSGAQVAPRNGVRRDWTDTSGQRHTYQFDRVTSWLIGLAEGFVSALAGIGGGPLIVPAIVRLLHFPVHIATATSTAVVTVAAVAGTGLHVAAGDFDFAADRIVPLGVGVVVGAQAGAWLSRRLSHGIILRLLAGGTAIMGIRLVLGALGRSPQG